MRDTLQLELFHGEGTEFIMAIVVTPDSGKAIDSFCKVNEREWLLTHGPDATDIRNSATGATKQEFGGRWKGLREVSTQLCLAHILKQLE